MHAETVLFHNSSADSAAAALFDSANTFRNFLWIQANAPTAVINHAPGFVCALEEPSYSILQCYEL